MCNPAGTSMFVEDRDWTTPSQELCASVLPQHAKIFTQCSRGIAGWIDISIHQLWDLWPYFPPGLFKDFAGLTWIILPEWPESESAARSSHSSIRRLYGLQELWIILRDDSPTDAIRQESPLSIVGQHFSFCSATACYGGGNKIPKPWSKEYFKLKPRNLVSTPSMWIQGGFDMMIFYFATFMQLIKIHQIHAYVNQLFFVNMERPCPNGFIFCMWFIILPPLKIMVHFHLDRKCPAVFTCILKYCYLYISL